MLKCLLSVLLITILLLTMNAFADTMPSLDAALRQITRLDKIELDPDEFNSFFPENTGEVNYGNYKLIVVQRKAADKEFTELNSGYPDKYVDDFPDDFTGVDIGKPTVWLRCDVMRSIPAYYQAKSFDEADIIVMAEDEYDFSGTLTVTNTKNGDDEDKQIPAGVNTPEEMNEYLSKKQPVIESIYHYPKFGVYNLITVYDTKTKKCEFFNVDYTSAKRFARNPEAADYWMVMEQIYDFYDLLHIDQTKKKKEYLNLQLNQLTDIDEKQISFWKQCIDAEQYEAAIASVDAYYWKMAERMVELDSDYEHKRNLDNAITWKEYDTFINLVNYYDYSGFDIPIGTIKLFKQYIQRADEKWTESNLQEFIDVMNN